MHTFIFIYQILIRYAEAHEVKEKIAINEKLEEDKWNKLHREKFEKKRRQLVVKQK